MKKEKKKGNQFRVRSFSMQPNPKERCDDHAILVATY
jgi:hypothetical protein